MGFPCYELVPAAVLLSNSGISGMEFIKSLRSLPLLDVRYSTRAKWDLGGERKNTPHFESEPLNKHLLARILRLPIRGEFYEVLDASRGEDEFGIGFGQSTFDEMFMHYSLDYSSFHVTTSEKSRLTENTQFGRFMLSGNISEGEVLQELGNFPTCIVERHVKAWPTEFPEWKDHAMLIREIERIHSLKSFDRLEDLIMEFPQFDPELMYDFSRAEGKLEGPAHNDNYFWKRSGDKLFLDTDKTFSRIGASGFLDAPGYTGLILTVEALKNRAYKLLSRSGINNLNNFFRRFPQSQKAYERAVWNSHTSLSSKYRTVNDLLRLRIEPC